MMRYTAGTAIRIVATIKDYENKLFNPTSVVISIYHGTTPLVSDESMTQVADGVFAYNFQSQSDKAGAYSLVIKAVHGDYTGKKRLNNAFYLS